MTVLGLTGGVGMGKTAIASLLVREGAQVLDTDQIARELVQPGQPALEEIRTAFGNGLIGPDGVLCREKLAETVFADPLARRKLEEILHPRIRERWLGQIAAWRLEGVRLAVVVIPLLFETGAETHFDKIICAACLPSSQQERLLARGWSTVHTNQRIAAQMPVEQKINRAHFVVWTEGRLESTDRQIACLLSRL
jgi:dephospho-CoA kinase